MPLLNTLFLLLVTVPAKIKPWLFKNLGMVWCSEGICAVSFVEGTTNDAFQLRRKPQMNRSLIVLKRLCHFLFSGRHSKKAFWGSEQTAASWLNLILSEAGFYLNCKSKSYHWMFNTGSKASILCWVVQLWRKGRQTKYGGENAIKHVPRCDAKTGTAT